MSADFVHLLAIEASAILGHLAGEGVPLSQIVPRVRAYPIVPPHGDRSAPSGTKSAVRDVAAKSDGLEHDAGLGFPPSNRSVGVVESNLEPTYVDHEHCTVAIGRVLLTYSRAAPSVPYLEAWRKEAARLRGAGNGPFFVMTVIDAARCQPPDDHCKRLIADSFKANRNAIAALAHVVEGSGFGAAAIRSALTLISLLGRHGISEKTFGNAADAAIWGLAKLGGGMGVARDVERVLAAVAEARNLVAPAAKTG